MVDLFGADKGNISLPPRLQSSKLPDGQPNDLKQVMILNMQKAMYEVRIADIAKRIQRLQSRNTELEELCVVEKELRSQTDIETGDQIAQLNRQIFGEMEKINDHKKRIQAIQKWMDEEKQAHLDKVEATNEKYAKTRLAITSKIKVLNAKINTLEEYKVAKTDLRNKLVAENNLMAQRDEGVKQRCEQIQRKFKISREKLKKEMYARLQGLAGTLQMEAAASIAKPIHALMRENIFVKNELIDIVRESVPKKEKIKLNKAADEQILIDTATSKKQTVRHLIESKIQGYLLAAVKEQHTRVKDCVEKLTEFDKCAINSAEVTYDSAKIKADKALRNISRLETGLHRNQTQLGLVNYLRDRSKTEIQRCTDVLCNAKCIVLCALEMIDSGKDILAMGDRELMNCLLDILCKGDTERWKNRTPSLATIALPEEAYRIGDLGFDPSHMKLHSPRRTTIQQEPSTLSTLKVLADLGVILSEVNSTRSQIEPSQTTMINLTQDSKDLMEDNSEEISKESSLSGHSQEEESEQKPVLLDSVLKEEPETDGEEDEEEEEEAEGKIETNKEVAQNEFAKQDEVDDKENITEKNQVNRSESLKEENSMQE